MNMLVILAFVGIITGLLAGTVGIGGGIILVPAMLAMGMPLAQSVTISLFIQSVPQTLPAMLMSASRPFPWVPAVTIAFASMFGGILGAWGIKKFNVREIILKKLLATILIILGIFTWYQA